MVLSVGSDLVNTSLKKPKPRFTRVLAAGTPPELWWWVLGEYDSEWWVAAGAALTRAGLRMAAAVRKETERDGVRMLKIG